MNINEILDDIKSKLTGDPQKDGPFLKSQSEKYREHDDYARLNRELGKLLFKISYDDYYSNMSAYLEQENAGSEESLENVRKRYEHRNYNAGMEILEKIIKDNALSWIDTEDVTYKSFGTPVEHAVYIRTCNPDKEIRSVSCDLGEVYYLYGMGLARKQRFGEAKNALETAMRFNPTDADIILEYLELMKSMNSYGEYRKYCDKGLICAVTKVQIGMLYFNYAFYFAEMNEYDKAGKMLEMSRIFYDNELVESEEDFLAHITGRRPARHTAKELEEFLESERIQPGPSYVVIDSAYKLAQDAARKLDYKLAKYLYEVVLELTESGEVRDMVEDLGRTIRDLEENR